jgi:hypothetical protein
MIKGNVDTDSTLLSLVNTVQSPVVSNAPTTYFAQTKHHINDKWSPRRKFGHKVKTLTKIKLVFFFFFFFFLGVWICVQFTWNRKDKSKDRNTGHRPMAWNLYYILLGCHDPKESRGPSQYPYIIVMREQMTYGHQFNLINKIYCYYNPILPAPKWAFF